MKKETANNKQTVNVETALVVKKRPAAEAVKKPAPAEVADYTEEERNEIVGKTNAQLKKMLDEGKLKDLLELYGRNGDYSLNNVLYMLAQYPDMTVANGMNEWARLGRHILPDSEAKRMEVMAPTKEEYQVEAKDKDGNPKLDENGEQIYYTRQRATGFHPFYVFDLSATEGEPYKPFCIEPGKVTNHERNVILDGVFNALSAKRYKYKFTEPKEFGENEAYKIDKGEKTVKIRKGMDNTTTALTAIEAASKAITDNYKGEDFEGLLGEKAELIEGDCRNCILAAHYGLQTTGFDFSYVQDWTDERKEIFRDNLGIVCAGTKSVMNKISHAMYKDRQARALDAPAPSGAIEEREPFQGHGQSAEIEAA